MQYRQLPKVLVVSLAILALSAGCGGSGGNSNPLSTTLKTEQSGNQWTYNITGTATPIGGGAAQPITGTATAQIGTTTFGGNPALTLQTVYNISVNGGVAVPITITYTFLQDANRNIIEQALSFEDTSGTTTKTVTNPSLANSEIVPGTFSNGETVAETINFTDTTSLAYQFVVGTPVQETTPAGTFDTWPTTITQAGVGAGTQDWDPALGAFVAGNLITPADVGGTDYTLNIIYSLASTNV